jgi:ABC-type enterobactin transport system permease subunit
LREVETMSSANIQFKALLVGIVIGAIAGIVVYITVRALGIKETASGAIIGGIVGAISVTLSRRKPLHRAN